MSYSYENVSRFSDSNNTDDSITSNFGSSLKNSKTIYRQDLISPQGEYDSLNVISRKQIKSPKIYQTNDLFLKDHSCDNKEFIIDNYNYGNSFQEALNLPDTTKNLELHNFIKKYIPESLDEDDINCKKSIEDSISINKSIPIEMTSTDCLKEMLVLLYKPQNMNLDISNLKLSFVDRFFLKYIVQKKLDIKLAKKHTIANCIQMINIAKTKVPKKDQFVSITNSSNLDSENRSKMTSTSTCYDEIKGPGRKPEEEYKMIFRNGKKQMFKKWIKDNNYANQTLKDKVFKFLEYFFGTKNSLECENCQKLQKIESSNWDRYLFLTFILVHKHNLYGSTF